MIIPKQSDITSQNISQSFEKGRYIDSYKNKKKGIVGQEYDIKKPKEKNLEYKGAYFKIGEKEYIVKRVENNILHTSNGKMFNVDRLKELNTKFELVQKKEKGSKAPRKAPTMTSAKFTSICKNAIKDLKRDGNHEGSYSEIVDLADSFLYDSDIKMFLARRLEREGEYHVTNRRIKEEIVNELSAHI